MDHRLVEGLMEAIAPLIKTYVDERIAKEVTPLHAQIKAYEAREPIKGEPGKDADPELVASVVAAEIAKALPVAVAAIPVPQNGKDADPVDPDVVARLLVDLMPAPVNGKDVDPAVLAEMISAEVAKIERPKDGKDADIEAVRSIIVEEIAKVAPADGKDAEPVDPVVVANILVDLMPTPVNGKDADPAVIAEMVAAEVAKIERPADGKSVDPADVEAMVELTVEKAMAGLTPPKDGKDGIDGKSVTLDEVAPLIEEAVSKIVVPEGPQGLPGEDGKSVTIDDVLPAIEGIIETKFSALPVPKDGAPGRDGKDGVGLAGAILGRSGDLVLTLSDGTTNSIGVIVGKDGEPGAAGEPGRDGVDGVGFDDLNVIETEDGAVLKFIRGDNVKEFPLAVPLDRGIWTDKEFKKGNGVTWGGSFWIAQRDTKSKPDTPDSGWRLAVKRGRDGKDGVMKAAPQLATVALK